jgi:UDP-N-acetylglucosamine--N-acetylmuramyl-(pentapeptide) pyrophosphoryl-undecaprenol N-acetylglucosamine transferase
MRVIMTGGGTGGHIFPAIAIADEIMKRDEKSKILFIGAKGRMEERVVPENNYEIKLIEVTGFNRKNIFNNVTFLKNYLNSLVKCKKIMVEFKPDVVVGTGGYVSGPVISSAVKKGIPTLIQEGNSYPGKVTKYLSGRVNRVVVNFKEAGKYLKRKDNVVEISYPVRNKLKVYGKEEASRFIGLNHNNKTLFVFGGSQGAKAINECLRASVKSLNENGINIIWQTGKSNYKEISESFGNKYENLKIFEFIKEMDAAYSASDLVVCRAGISSIMELSLFKKPAILVPLPTAAENHQEKNALSLIERNAAIMIKEENLNSTFLDVVNETINSEPILKSLSENISKIYDIDAPFKIYNEIKNIIN